MAANRSRKPTAAAAASPIETQEDSPQAVSSIINAGQTNISEIREGGADVHGREVGQPERNQTEELVALDSAPANPKLARTISQGFEEKADMNDQLDIQSESKINTLRDLIDTVFPNTHKSVRDDISVGLRNRGVSTIRDIRKVKAAPAQEIIVAGFRDRARHIYRNPKNEAVKAELEQLGDPVEPDMEMLYQALRHRSGYGDIFTLKREAEKYI